MVILWVNFAPNVKTRPLLTSWQVLIGGPTPIQVLAPPSETGLVSHFASKQVLSPDEASIFAAGYRGLSLFPQENLFFFQCFQILPIIISNANYSRLQCCCLSPNLSTFQDFFSSFFVIATSQRPSRWHTHVRPRRPLMSRHNKTDNSLLLRQQQQQESQRSVRAAIRHQRAIFSSGIQKQLCVADFNERVRTHRSAATTGDSALVDTSPRAHEKWI